jgi:hypothetical protein
VISDDDIEKALDFLRDNARPAAKAKAEAQYMDDYKKVVKARIMREHDEKPLGAQEREAYADPRYEQHLKASQDAIERDEYLRWMRDAANAKIEAWRTQCSNERAKV